MSEPILDAKRLSNFVDMIGADQVALLVDEYKADALRIISEMHDAFARQDIDALFAGAHTLKGTSLTFGLLQLANICAQIGALTRIGKLDGIDTLLTQLPPTLTTGLDALAQALPK